MWLSLIKKGVIIMFTYNSISADEIARKLGLQKSKNGNYHCFNQSFHKNGDQNPSLSISKENIGFNCFGCGIHGNNVELVKLYLNIGTDDAIEWLKANFSHKGRGR